MPSSSSLDDPLPPAFYPVGLNLVGRRCVIIGDDREAEEKSVALSEVGAVVERITDVASLRDEQLVDAFFVIVTPQDPALAARLRDLSEKYRFLYCAIDQPRYGFIAMQAIVRAGPARIGISTGGVAPRIGKELRLALQGALDSTFAEFLSCLATQKLRNRRRFAESLAARRAAMIAASEGFEASITIRYPRWFNERRRRMQPLPLVASPLEETPDAAR